MIGTVEQIAYTMSGYQVTTIDGVKYATLFDLSKVPVQVGKNVEYQLSNHKLPFTALPYADILAVFESSQRGDGATGQS